MNGCMYKYWAPLGNDYDEWYAYIRQISEMAEDEAVSEIVLL